MGFNGDREHPFGDVLLLIDTLIANEAEKDRLLGAIDEIECVKDKAEWALKWIESENLLSDWWRLPR